VLADVVHKLLVEVLDRGEDAAADDVALVLAAAHEFHWLRRQWYSWLGRKIIEALDEAQAGRLLTVLIPYPQLQTDCEYVVASIAKRFPVLALHFIGERIAFAQSGAAPSQYDAVPFSLFELKDGLREQLAAAPALLLEEAQAWYRINPLHFPYDGARLIASVFPGLDGGLEEVVTELVVAGNDGDLAFVLALLEAFEGAECVYEPLRVVVARLAPDSPLLEQVTRVLIASGVVTGEFGFAEQNTKRRRLMLPWLGAESANVRAFAAARIKELDATIAAETRAAEASTAMRKLQYGEDLDG